MQPYARRFPVRELDTRRLERLLDKRYRGDICRLSILKSRDRVRSDASAFR